MKRTSAALLFCGIVSGGLLAGALSAVAQSPAPQITVNKVPAAATPSEAQPAHAAKTAAAGGEVLPWANQPLTPVASLPEAESAAQQCSGLFEAACRDLKTCAWVADVKLSDGTLVPARCAARASKIPKSTAKKSTTAKKKEAAVSGPAAPPTALPVAAQSESVPQNTARVVVREDDPAPAPSKKQRPAPKPRVEAKAAPAVQKQEEAEEKPAKQAEAKPKPTQPAPQAPQPSPMPSFGSIGGFGGGNAVVVTVPPSSN